MNETPPGDALPDEIDDLYRRVAARDPSQPSEVARHSILENARHVAAGYARTRSRRTWQPALFGTLAAALLAGLVVIPRLWSPPTAAPALASNYPYAPQSDADTSAKKSLGSVAAPAPEPAPAPRMSKIAPAPRAEAKPSAAAQLAAAAPAAQDGARDSMNEAQTAAGAMAAKISPSSRQRVDSSEALRLAAQAGDSRRLSRALAEPGDINARDEGGRTALMLAVLNGRVDAVDALLAHGADPNIADAMGTLPLAAAVPGQNLSIISALRRAGARETAQ